MKLIILLGGRGSRMRPLTWSRPKALLSVAGGTVLGHMLDLMSDLTHDEVIFVTGPHGDQIERWIEENYPELDSHFVVQESPLGQAHAVSLCQAFLQDEEEVVLAFGDGIFDADFANFATRAEEMEADAVFLVDEFEDPRQFGVVVLDQAGYVSGFLEKPQTREHSHVVVGVNWFRSSRQLYEAVSRTIAEKRQTLGEFFMADAYKLMLEEGVRIVTQPVKQWSDAGQPQTLLKTNARMLAMGYHSAQAIERSYAEDFTVVPPVFLHPDATVERAVIGPYTTIGPNALIKNALVRNSIVEAGAEIVDCILDGALIGERAKVTGRGKTLMVGDDSVVELN